MRGACLRHKDFSRLHFHWLLLPLWLAKLGTLERELVILLHERLFEAHQLLVQGSLHINNLLVLLRFLVGLELFMPVVLLHLLYTLPVLAACGLQVALGGVVERLALDAVAAELDGLVVALVVLLHDHLVVAVVVQMVVVHDDSLLDGLLQWRVSQMVDDTTVHRSMANALVRLLLSAVHLGIIRPVVEVHFLRHGGRLNPLLRRQHADIFALNVEGQRLHLGLVYGVAEAQLLLRVARLVRTAADHQVELLPKLGNVGLIHRLLLTHVPTRLHLVQLDVKAAGGVGESVRLRRRLQLRILVSAAIAAERVLPHSVPRRLHAIEFVDHVAEGLGALGVAVEALLKLRVRRKL